MAGNQSNNRGTRRRTVLKRCGAAAVASTVGVTLGSTSVAAEDLPEWDPGNEGLAFIDINHEVVGQDGQGDDIYEIDIEWAWGSPYLDEYTDEHPHAQDSKLTVTVWWDDNIFGWDGFEDSGGYAQYADEINPGYPPETFVREGSGTDYDTFSDYGMLSEVSDGWTAEFEVGSRRYETEDTMDPGSWYGPTYVPCDVTFHLLHQDSSAGRLWFEIASEYSDGIDGVSLCTGGKVSVCYDGWGGPSDTIGMTSDGYRIPSN